MVRQMTGTGWYMHHRARLNSPESRESKSTMSTRTRTALTWLGILVLEALIVLIIVWASTPTPSK